jgi:hypothetical protein
VIVALLVTFGVLGVALVALVAVVIASLPSCEVEGLDDINLDLSSPALVPVDDGIRVVPPTCMATMTVIDVAGSGYAGLWHLEAGTPQPATQVTIGTAPAGFAESRPFNGPLPSRLSVMILGETAQRGGMVAWGDFAVSDVRPGQILTTDGPVDLAGFASMHCP